MPALMKPWREILPLMKAGKADRPVDRNLFEVASAKMPKRDVE
jgi:hypothetical protein